MIKPFIKFATIAAVAASLAACPTFAGVSTKKVQEVVIQEPEKWWGAELSTGYDSLYMFRGVNLLRLDKSYGSGIWWTDLNFTFTPWENGSFNVGGWWAFGLSSTDYKELDIYTSYTHSIGNLDLTLGYTMYALIESKTYSHELNVGAGYNVDLGFMSLTPGIYYYFNLGPDIGSNGFAESASSFLQLRLDASAPVYKDSVALEPYMAFGTNFRYNFNDDGNPFSGVNNLEFGVALPIQLSKVVSVSPYAAYSQAIYSGGLLDTRRATFWGGGSVTFSF